MSLVSTPTMIIGVRTGSIQRQRRIVVAIAFICVIGIVITLSVVLSRRSSIKYLANSTLTNGKHLTQFTSTETIVFGSMSLLFGICRSCRAFLY
ncbi:unnamed protein product [Adineta ricciae]|uniref:Uncharacterized protein n=1 Tax=Adineta ricciae TaxID=249248 RepID=A0A815RDK9_ADIRI|nr:unnamed protein product [Adineta ricciae]